MTVTRCIPDCRIYFSFWRLTCPFGNVTDRLDILTSGKWLSITRSSLSWFYWNRYNNFLVIFFSFFFKVEKNHLWRRLKDSCEVQKKKTAPVSLIRNLDVLAHLCLTWTQPISLEYVYQIIDNVLLFPVLFQQHFPIFSSFFWP